MDVFGTVGNMETVNFQGKTDLLIITESLIPAGISAAEIDTNLRILKKKYFHNLREMMRVHRATLMPGIMDLLEKLRGRKGVITGLLTGNFMESAYIKLNRFDLGDYFSFGVFGCDAVNRNDMPGIARMILKKKFSLDIDFRDMVIIGDTIYDIECSKKSGAVSVSVGTGWTDREILLKNNPDFYFDDLRDTRQVVTSILN